MGRVSGFRMTDHGKQERVRCTMEEFAETMIKHDTTMEIRSVGEEIATTTPVAVIIVCSEDSTRQGARLH